MSFLRICNSLLELLVLCNSCQWFMNTFVNTDCYNIYSGPFSHGVATFHMFCVLSVVLLHKGTLMLCSAIGPVVRCCVGPTYAPYSQTLHWQENNGAGGWHKRTFNSLWMTASHPSIRQYSASITALPRDSLLPAPAALTSLSMCSLAELMLKHFKWLWGFVLLSAEQS